MTKKIRLAAGQKRQENIVIPFNNYVPVKDWEVWDEKQHIYRGIVIAHPVSPRRKIQEGPMWFLWEEQVQNQMLSTPAILEFDKRLLGYPFLMVPQEYLIMSYHKGGGIIIPDVSKFARQPIRRTQ